MAKRHRRVLAQRRREGGVTRGWVGDDFDVQAAVDEALLEGGERVSGARSVPLDAQRARAIPIIGPMSGGGAVPGTVPHRQRRLDRWSGH